MNYEKLRQQMLEVSGSTDAQVDSYLKYVEEQAKMPGWDYNNFSSIDLLIKSGSVKLKITAYRRRKAYTTILYSHLYEEGGVYSKALEYVSNHQFSMAGKDEQLNSYYFASLDNALNRLFSTANAHGFNAESDLDLYKAIVILLWCRGKIAPKDIFDIRKSDLCSDPMGVFIGGELIRLSKRAWCILDRFAGSDCYRTFPSGKVYPFVESPYLLRTSQRVQMDSKSLENIIRKFNHSDEYKRGFKELSLSCLPVNGAFERVYLEAKQDWNSIPKLIARELNTTIDYGYNNRDLYLKWCARYHGTEVE